MNRAGALKPYATPMFLLAASAVFAAEWIVVRSSVFANNPELIGTAVTFDIVTVVPLLFYFLVLRPRQHSAIFVVPCFFLCNLVAWKLLPAVGHGFLLSLGRFSPLLELALMAFVASRVPGMVRTYRAERPATPYFSDALLKTLRRTLGQNPIFVIVTVETLLVLYAFGGWFLRWKQTQGTAFTYYKKAGYSAILGILLFVGITETVAVHMILARWSLLVAWILTGLSLYGILWIVGDYHAIRLHPILVHDGMLHLRTGLRWRADIPLGLIADVEPGGPKNSKSKSYLRASVLWPRAIIVLKEPVKVDGLFGIHRTVTQIGVSVDDPELFRSTVAGQMRSTE